METGGSSKLFIFSAFILIGLICIGLGGVGVVFYVTRSNQAQNNVVVEAPTTTPFAPTFTPTLTPTPTPTDTPTSTSTPTLVVVTPTDDALPTETLAVEPTEADSTNTPVSQTASSASDTPTPAPTPELISESGGILFETNNSFLLWAGGGLLLMVVIYGSFSYFRVSVQEQHKE